MILKKKIRAIKQDRYRGYQNVAVEINGKTLFILAEHPAVLTKLGYSLRPELMVSPNNDKNALKVGTDAYYSNQDGYMTDYIKRAIGADQLIVNDTIVGVDKLNNATKKFEQKKLAVFEEGPILIRPAGIIGSIFNVVPLRPDGQAVVAGIFGGRGIIEYRYNSINMGAFENVLPLLDEINNIVSNACDGIEQFIQSLAIAVNCEFPEDTTLSTIRKAGFISFRSVGENKADFKVLTEQLDQTQTKTLVDSLYDEVLRICAMPSRSNGGSTYDTTGAAVLANFGWYQADAAARNTEDLFKESNRQFDRIIVEILRRKGLLDINVNDFELNFVRNETANVQSKAQAFQTLMSAGLHPELAAAKSGISNDPVKDMKMSEKWLEMIWGNPEKVVKAEQTDGGQGEAEIVEEDSNNGENDTGGSV